MTLTREEFEIVTRPLMERTIELTRRALAAARERGTPRIDRCLLVGGSSKMPVVARRLTEEFGFTTQLADPDLAVAKGAALHGHKKMLERLVSDATVKGVDLRQALADAAGEHGMTSDAVKQVVDKRVVNVVSRGFGVLAKQDDVLTSVFLVHRNDPVPLEVVELFFTVVDDQTDIRVQVIEQGGAEESPDPADATVLVKGEISDLPPGDPKGAGRSSLHRLMLKSTKRLERSRRGRPWGPCLRCT